MTGKERLRDDQIWHMTAGNINIHCITDSKLLAAVRLECRSGGDRAGGRTEKMRTNKKDKMRKDGARTAQTMSAHWSGLF